MQTKLRVTESAEALIQSQLCSSSFSDPVVCLVCQTQQFDCPELTQAILGGASKAALKRLADEKMEEFRNDSKMKLFVSAIEGRGLAAESVILINKTRFVLPVEMQNIMENWELDIAEDGQSLVLKDAGGTVILPPPQ